MTPDRGEDGDRQSQSDTQCVTYEETTGRTVDTSEQRAFKQMKKGVLQHRNIALYLLILRSKSVKMCIFI